MQQTCLIAARCSWVRATLAIRPKASSKHLTRTPMVRWCRPCHLGRVRISCPTPLERCHRIGNTATGPNITDDQVFRYRYDHRGRLVDIERKSDAEIIEERRYDAIGVEGNRQLVDLEVANADFSTGATTHVWYSRSDVNLQGGGVKFDYIGKPEPRTSRSPATCTGSPATTGLLRSGLRTDHLPD